MLVSILAIVFVLRISKNSDRYAPIFILIFHSDQIGFQPIFMQAEQSFNFTKSH